MSEYMNKELFEQDVRGFLFYNEKTMGGKERSKMIFDFTKETLYKLREGDFVAVESFTNLAPHEGGKCYTLLEVVSLSPTHITIDRLKKYKFMGAVREFLKKSTKDFEEDVHVIRDHVYIEASAEPTGYMMKVTDNSNVEFVQEPSKPILGRDVGVLKAKVLKKLINKGIEEGTVIGKLFSNYEEKQIPVLINAKKMITHHYAIFGFTGSGKSNFNSIMLSRLLEKPNLKIIVFDLLDEYTDLLIDKITSHGFVVVEERDVPASVIEYLKTEDNEKLDQASEDLARISKKPGIFDSENFVPVYKTLFKEILEGKRIKIYNPSISTAERIETVQDFFDHLERRVTSDKEEKYLESMIDLIPKIAEERNLSIKDLTEWKITDIEDFEGFILALRDAAKVWSSSAFYGSIDALLSRIQHAGKQESETQEYYADMNWVLEQFVLNTDPEPKLCILVSTDKELMISMITELIEESLERRRRITRIHDVLFAIDEAHEFVLGGTARPSRSEQASSLAIERLTRMGRKYGLGACIASQRVAYLNTTAISNCHTTFIGSLPRRYDREAIYQAYAISEDVLNQVVTFPPGNWYAVSMNAMGITNVPIRIIAPNREVELAKFLKDQGHLDENVIHVLKEVGYL